MDLEFQWDEAKAASNKKKHSVTFEDPSAVVFDYVSHSKDEAREIIVGHSSKNRLVIVCFTERGDSIRIVSARCANRKERNDYEEDTIK